MTNLLMHLISKSVFHELYVSTILKMLVRLLNLGPDHNKVEWVYFSQLTCQLKGHMSNAVLIMMLHIHPLFDTNLARSKSMPSIVLALGITAVIILQLHFEARGNPYNFDDPLENATQMSVQVSSE